jgi:hypothetical protein
MSQFPITITEVPHQGPRQTWTIYDEKHLARCIESSERAGYSNWQQQEGRLSFVEKEDDEFEIIDNGAYTLEAYLDWLRHDLSQLIIHDAEGI